MCRSPRAVWPIAALVLATSTLGVSAAEPPMRTIEVSAGSEIYVRPDEVLLWLSAYTRNKDLLKAKAENDRLTRSILNLGPKYRIPEERLQIDRFSIQPVYERRPGETEREFVGYSVNRQVQITLRDFTMLEPLLSDALGAGVTRLDRILYRTTKHREHQFAARRLAMEHAREKAGHLTELSGLKLGKPIKIEHGVEGDEHAPLFSVIPTVGGGGKGFFQSSVPTAGNVDGGGLTVRLISTRSADQAAQRPQPIAPGLLTISATVTITFEMVE